MRQSSATDFCTSKRARLAIMTNNQILNYLWDFAYNRTFSPSSGVAASTSGTWVLFLILIDNFKRIIVLILLLGWWVLSKWLS